MKEEARKVEEDREEEENSLVKMKIEEESAMNEISQLQEEIQELHRQMEEQKQELKNESQELFQLEPSLTQKKNELEELKITVLDETEIKTVLNERMKGIELKGEQVLREITDFENEIFSLRSKEKMIERELGEFEAREKVLMDNIERVGEEKQRVVEENHEKELGYKRELLKEEEEKENFERDLDIMKVKIGDLEDLVRCKEQEVLKLDNKISELVKIRKEIGDVSICLDA